MRNHRQYRTFKLNNRLILSNIKAFEKNNRTTFDFYYVLDKTNVFLK